jgi:hypothetical protein
MNSQFKLGQILCVRRNLRKLANKRFYYVVIQQETNDAYLVIQPINSNPPFISGASINTINPENLVLTQLRASYLLHYEITVLESFFNEPYISDALGCEGNDRIVKFTAIYDDFIGNVCYETKKPKKINPVRLLIF